MYNILRHFTMQRGIPLCIQSSVNKITIRVQAKPNSRSSAIVDINDEYVGISIAAPAHDGEANKELCEYLASIVPGAKKRDVTIRPGSQKSRSKLVEIQTGIQPTQFYEILLSNRG